MDAFSHELPFLLLLPASERVEAALPRMLADERLRHYALPPLWALDGAGIDLPAALPAVRTVTLGSLEAIVGELLRLCDHEALEALVRSAWREADERVRQHHLDLGVGATFATIFRVAPRTVEREPPPSFWRDRIHESAFEIQYRLAPAGAGTPRSDRRAPEEEGSVVLYPFDPRGEAARAEAGLPREAGGVLEVFAYEVGRARHLETWRAIAADLGWRVAETR